jgi:hypothetical protein
MLLAQCRVQIASGDPPEQSLKGHAMTSLKRTNLWAATAGRTDALTASWKKAFDARIRTAALTRRLPPGRRPATKTAK